MTEIRCENPEIRCIRTSQTALVLKNDWIHSHSSLTFSLYVFSLTPLIYSLQLPIRLWTALKPIQQRFISTRNLHLKHISDNRIIVVSQSGYWFCFWDVDFTVGEYGVGNVDREDFAEYDVDLRFCVSTTSKEGRVGTGEVGVEEWQKRGEREA